MKQPSDQKNFRLGVERVELFNEWCRKRSRGPIETLYAGWLVLEQMAVEDLDGSRQTARAVFAYVQ